MKLGKGINPYNNLPPGFRSLKAKVKMAAE